MTNLKQYYQQILPWLQESVKDRLIRKWRTLELYWKLLRLRLFKI